MFRRPAGCGAVQMKEFFSATDKAVYVIKTYVLFDFITELKNSAWAL